MEQKLHHNEVDINLELVHQLIQKQFPQWAELPLELILPEGTDNVMYQLGTDKVVRLPRTEGAAQSLEIERLWLSKLAPSLPIPIPVPQGVGKPSSDYPFPWLVCNRLEGETPLNDSCLDLLQAAKDMGNFVKDLQKIDPTGAPLCNRGKPLISRDKATRSSIKALEELYDSRSLTALWEQALAAPNWSGTPVWIHGDLHPGNLLVWNKRISGVVDFGLAGVGDPACDMMVAWTLLTSETREVFRSIVQPDEATWERGRGWALTLGIVAYPYYCKTNPPLATIAKRTLEQIMG